LMRERHHRHLLQGSKMMSTHKYREVV
jgi:hypothetical protein